LNADNRSNLCRARVRPGLDKLKNSGPGLKRWHKPVDTFLIQFWKVAGKSLNVDEFTMIFSQKMFSFRSFLISSFTTLKIGNRGVFFRRGAAGAWRRVRVAGGCRRATGTAAAALLLLGPVCGRGGAVGAAGRTRRSGRAAAAPGLGRRHSRQAAALPAACAHARPLRGAGATWYVGRGKIPVGGCLYLHAIRFAIDSGFDIPVRLSHDILARGGANTLTKPRYCLLDSHSLLRLRSAPRPSGRRARPIRTTSPTRRRPRTTSTACASSSARNHENWFLRSLFVYFLLFLVFCK